MIKLEYLSISGSVDYIFDAESRKFLVPNLPFDNMKVLFFQIRQS